MRKPRLPSPAPPGRPGRTVSREESDLWREVTDDITPLASREGPTGAAAAPETADKAGQPEPAPAKPKSVPPPRRSPPPPPPPAPFPPPEPELRHGAAPGLDKRTRLRLRRGQVDIEATIDLHGHTQVEAHRALEAFLQGSWEAGQRAVLVITGKGGVAGSRGVLRDAVPGWLNQEPNRRMIKAFAHAAPKDGGEGALYVLLKRRK